MNLPRKRGSLGLITPRLLIVLTPILFLASCASDPYSPYWKSFAFQQGVALHHEGFQQTAYDTNSDGRMDRLRYWRGSGIARELHDNNKDGWFDTRVIIVYGEERSRNHLRIRAPFMPKHGTDKDFNFHELVND